jgi:hypothetical protein
VNTVGEPCGVSRQSCDGLAGVSPARVVTKQPCSWWPAEGEIRPSKRHDQVPLGGERVISPYDEESCRVAISDLRKQDETGAELGTRVAKAMDGAKNLEVQHPRTRRRRGIGMITQPITERERSVSAPGDTAVGRQSTVPGKREAYKRLPREVVERRAEVGGGHMVAVKARTT